MKRVIKVKMPLWWSETDEYVVGYTDGVDTFACSSEAVWFVSVPAFEYEGYFAVTDLEVIK